mmetsp:Transcript_638/g.934  ORF Transcript_638/g.934 Transcript_638/m.934 type:complete len:227 (-) Transcript_638:241-921(-)
MNLCSTGQALASCKRRKSIATEILGPMRTRNDALTSSPPPKKRSSRGWRRATAGCETHRSCATLLPTSAWLANLASAQRSSYGSLASRNNISSCATRCLPGSLRCHLPTAIRKIFTGAMGPFSTSRTSTPSSSQILWSLGWPCGTNHRASMRLSTRSNSPVTQAERFGGERCGNILKQTRVRLDGRPQLHPLSRMWRKRWFENLYRPNFFKTYSKGLAARTWGQMI